MRPWQIKLSNIFLFRVFPSIPAVNALAQDINPSYLGHCSNLSEDNAALQTPGVKRSQTSQELAHAFSLEFNLWATWYHFGELWNLKIKISQTFEL